MVLHLLLGCLTLPGGYWAAFDAAGDLDGDGYLSSDYGGPDCVDDDDRIHPGQTEAPYNGLDDDCDLATPDDDLDGDGVGHDHDCDDLDPERAPGHDEVWYDGIDQACDGGNDYDRDGDGLEVEADCDDTDRSVGEPQQLYVDSDGDGFGNVQLGQGCESLGQTWADGDCDDGSADIHPDAQEVCGNLVDDDCSSDTSCRRVGVETFSDWSWIGDGIGVDRDFGIGFAAGADTNGVAVSSLTVRCVLVFTSADGSEQARICHDDWTYGPPAFALTDLHRDGGADLLVAHGGVAHLVYGPLGELALSDADAEFEGSGVGFADLDSDSWPDVITTGVDDGAVVIRVFRGQRQDFSGLYTTSDAHATISWPHSEGAPSGVNTADMTGDGVDDLIASSPRTDELWVYSSLDRGITSHTDSDSYLSGDAASGFGSAVSSGDTNGDGYQDLVVGAPQSSLGGPSGGAVYVYEGPLNAVPGEADVVLVGETRQLLGIGTCSGLDFDQDGQDDVVVGVPGLEDGPGSAVVLYGPLAGTQSIADLSGVTLAGEGTENAGMAVACPGDLNGDGYDDAVIGADGGYPIESTRRIGLLLGAGQ